MNSRTGWGVALAVWAVWGFGLGARLAAGAEPSQPPKDVRMRAGHPRLFIHQDNKALCQQRMNDPQLAAIWANIRGQGSGDIEGTLKSIRDQKANRFYGLGWYLPSAVGNPALVYSLTGDKSCAERIRRAWRTVRR